VGRGGWKKMGLDSCHGSEDCQRLWGKAVWGTQLGEEIPWLPPLSVMFVRADIGSERTGGRRVAAAMGI